MSNQSHPEVPVACSCGGAVKPIPGYVNKYQCGACKTTDASRFVWINLPANASREIDELLEFRRQEELKNFEVDRINRSLSVSFKHSEPIAIVAMGDPHLDDPGTKISKVEEDLKYVQDNENVYGMCVGDITNNWVGRLQAIYGEQTTTATESWTLAEWFCESIPWLAMVLGNHDKWNNGAEILQRLTQGKLVQADECAFTISFANGIEFSVNARHKWKGTSMWNPAHGISRYAQMGADYDIILGGHTHQSAYCQVLGTRKRTITHCLQLASYKLLDKYARTEGFKYNTIAPSMCIVIDPQAERPEDQIVCTYSIENGILMHKALMAKYAIKNKTIEVDPKKAKTAIQKAKPSAPKKVAKKKEKIAPAASKKISNRVTSKVNPLTYSHG